MSVIRYKNNPLHLQCVGIRGQTKGEKKRDVQVYLLVGSNCTKTVTAKTRYFTNAALTDII
jgi:hypothetical protein